MTWPKLYVVLLTYKRFEYAQTTLRSTLNGLQYSGEVSVHIADDGSPGEHAGMLVEIAGGYETIQGVSASNSGQRGYGANFNLAMQTVHGFLGDDGLVMPLEDDWELTRPLDLSPIVEDMRSAELGCVRLGYLGWTQTLCGRFWTRQSEQGHRAYVRFDPDSPERHILAGAPRLETVEFERKIGPWPEGLAPGTTEFEVCGREAARERVAFLIRHANRTDPVYAHIGTVRSIEA